MTRNSNVFILSFFLLVATFFTSCTENETMPEPQPTLSTEEFAELIEVSLAPSNGGWVEILESSTKTMESLNLQDYCNNTYGDTLEYEYTGARIQANSETIFNLDLVCNGFNIPQASGVSINSAVNFNTPRIKSNNSSSFQGSLTGLELVAPDINWNGTFSQAGIHELNFDQIQKGTSTFEFTMSDLIINKQTQVISSGSGIYEFTINVNEFSQTVAGTITFNGDQTVTIVVNDREFIIELD